MARPKNVVVVNGNTVFSIAPGKFKEMLAARALGQEFPAVIGKEIGPVFANVAGMTDVTAGALLATLTPAPAPVVVAAPAETPATPEAATLPPAEVVAAPATV